MGLTIKGKKIFFFEGYLLKDLSELVVGYKPIVLIHNNLFELFLRILAFCFCT